MANRSTFALMLLKAEEKRQQATKTARPTPPAARAAQRPQPVTQRPAAAEEEGAVVTHMSAADRAMVAAIIRDEHLASVKVSKPEPVSDPGHGFAVAVERAVAMRENRAPAALIAGPTQHRRRVFGGEIIQAARAAGKI